MREQLTQYVNLLFAGAENADEIRAEILQNTLDRFDDLVDQGKSPEAAYRLAITGIGDINEILYGTPAANTSAAPMQQSSPEATSEEDRKHKKIRAAAIALYILSAIPLIVLSEIGYDIIGLSLTIIMVAAATYNMLLTSKKDDEDAERPIPVQPASSPAKKLVKSVESLIWAIGLAVYFILSYATGAWYITWILFPIIGCTEGLVKAIIDLMEVKKYET